MYKTENCPSTLKQNCLCWDVLHCMLKKVTSMPKKKSTEWNHAEYKHEHDHFPLFKTHLEILENCKGCYRTTLTHNSTWMSVHYQTGQVGHSGLKFVRAKGRPYTKRQGQALSAGTTTAIRAYNCRQSQRQHCNRIASSTLKICPCVCLLRWKWCHKCKSTAK